MTNKLTVKEKREPMLTTWGRIRAIAGRTVYRKAELNIKRLENLVEKFNTDLSKAKVEENYFK